MNEVHRLYLVLHASLFSEDNDVERYAFYGKSSLAVSRAQHAMAGATEASFLNARARLGCALVGPYAGVERDHVLRYL